MYRRFDNYTVTQAGQQREQTQQSRQMPYPPQQGNNGNHPQQPSRQIAQPQQQGQQSLQGQVVPSKVQGARQGAEINSGRPTVQRQQRLPKIKSPQKVASFRQTTSYKKPTQTRKRPLNFNFLNGFLPTSIYDAHSKKIFGFLSAEDLLLVALILLFLEKDDGDNTLMIVALAYILISEYIDLPEISL